MVPGTRPLPIVIGKITALLRLRVKGRYNYCTCLFGLPGKGAAQGVQVPGGSCCCWAPSQWLGYHLALAGRKGRGGKKDGPNPLTFVYRRTSMVVWEAGEEINPPIPPLYKEAFIWL